MAENEQPIPKEQPQVVSVAQSEIRLYNFSDFSYDTGFADGALRLGELPYYETFSTNLEKRDLAEQLLERCRQEIARLKTELASIKQRTLELYSTIFDREEKVRFTEIRLKEAYQKKEEIKNEIQTLESRRRLIDPENSWFVASLLLISGFAFIVADVLITKDIMEQVLSLSKSDSWIISISISLTVFGIKPVIDRVFERPRWEQNKIVRNNVLLIVTGILILILLALLGYIRVKGYSIIVVGANSDALLEIFKNPSLLAVFVIASMLFAIVGALCLSMGFRSLEQNNERWGLSKKSENATRLLTYQENRIFELLDIETKYRKELREVQKELELQPSQAQLEMRLAGLESQEKDLMGLVAEANSTAQAAWYREGAARGERFNVSGELYVSPIRMERWVVPESIQGPYRGRWARNGNNNAQESGESPKTTTYRPGDYLYQQIRNAIALHDNRTNKKSFSNGKQS
jgi:hypothetical protein